MAKKQPKDPTKQAVEVQSARLRALAGELREYAEGRRDEALFISWAETIANCSHALTKAVADDDPEWRDRLLDFAKENAKLVVATALTAVITLSANSVLSSDEPSDGRRLYECATEVLEQAQTIEHLLHPVEVSASASLGPMTAEAHGAASPAQPIGTDEAHALYDDGLQGNRVQYGERDEDGRPVQSGTVEVPEPSTIENLGYVGSDLPSIGPGQPQKSLTILQLRKTVGLRLAEIRRLLGRTLEQMAEEYAMPVSTIANIESGYTNQNDLEDYVKALVVSKRYQASDPQTASLMMDVRALTAQARLD